MGIDYGLGKTNIDTKTGIRYGVISQNELLQDWCESSKPYYNCENCEYNEENNKEYPDNCDFCEPTSFYIDNNEYFAESDSYGDIFIIKSPYYTLCEYCSPCAPGAGYLVNEGSVKAYCFGPEWFEDKLPYKIYNVSDNKEVKQCTS